MVVFVDENYDTCTKYDWSHRNGNGCLSECLPHVFPFLPFFDTSILFHPSFSLPPSSLSSLSPSFPLFLSPLLLSTNSYVTPFWTKKVRLNFCSLVNKNMFTVILIITLSTIASISFHFHFLLTKVRKVSASLNWYLFNKKIVGQCHKSTCSSSWALWETDLSRENDGTCKLYSQLHQKRMKLPPTLAA